MAAPNPLPALATDIAPPKRWKRFIPSWLRSLIWADSSPRYDAFLSYSWRSDKAIAPVIQSIIHRFLRPWYKTRAKTIFRDLSCLPAGSNLNREICSRLDRAVHLIVLASPQAATSDGMEMEAKHWFSRERTGEVLIIVTGRLSGEGRTVEWDEIRRYLLPPTLRTRFADTEPLWVSIDHRRADILASRSDETIRGQLIEDLRQVFLCFYPGATWEELRGEERKQRRRAMSLMAGAAVLFLVAALAILVGLRNTQKARNEAVFNYKSAVDVATAIGKVVKDQLQPDGAQQPRSVLANSLLNASETVENMPADYEYPAAAMSRVQLLELLWNNSYILGKFEDASKAAKAEFQIASKYGAAKRFNQGDPSRADWLRYMCRAKENLGDDARATGDRKSAQADFQQAVELATRLSAEPAAGAWKSELPHAYERLGDVLRDERDFSGALMNFRAFQAAFHAAGDPADTASQRNLAVVHGKIGDILIQQQDLEGAEREFQENLAISEKLMGAVPNSADLQRGVAIAHERLGFVKRKRSEFPEAAQDYHRELAIVQQMLEGDNADFQWGRDEALANEGLGDVAFDQDRFREAYEYYQAYLKSIARVLQKAPSNARIRREVAVAYQRVGEVALRLEKRDEARTEFQMCSETAEHASTAFEPRNPEPQNTGEYCRAKLAAIAPIAAVHRVPTP